MPDWSKDSELWVRVPPKEPIPKIAHDAPHTKISGENFMYVLFLYESEIFISDTQARIQYEMNRIFQEFGDAIGLKALAITFETSDKSMIDVERNSKYITQFGLPAKKSPYIVVVEKHPDELTKGDHIFAVSFNRIDLDRLKLLLADLKDHIQSGKLPGNKMRMRIAYEGIKKWFNDHRADLKEGSDIISKIQP